MPEPFVTCLALALFFEARGEPIEGQMAVADVIMERTEDPRYPGNVCDVVFQSRQFSFVENNETPAPSGPAWSNAKNLSQSILLGEVPLPGLGATHYHAAYVSPYWVSGADLVAEIGGHLFYAGIE